MNTLKTILLLSLCFVAGCTIPVDFVGYFWATENKNIDINMLDKHSEFKKEPLFGNEAIKNCNQYTKAGIKIIICSNTNGAFIAFQKPESQKMSDDETTVQIAQFKQIIDIPDVKNKEIELKDKNYVYDYVHAIKK